MAPTLNGGSGISRYLKSPSFEINNRFYIVSANKFFKKFGIFLSVTINRAYPNPTRWWHKFLQIVLSFVCMKNYVLRAYKVLFRKINKCGLEDEFSSLICDN